MYLRKDKDIVMPKIAVNGNLISNQQYMDLLGTHKELKEVVLYAIKAGRNSDAIADALINVLVSYSDPNLNLLKQALELIFNRQQVMGFPGAKYFQQ